jgi:hypothetical protein
VGLIVASIGIHRWSAGAKLEAAIQRVHDAGHPVTYAELDEYYQWPASGENRADILAEAFEATVEPDEDILEEIPFFGDDALLHRTVPFSEATVRLMRSHSEQNSEAIDLVYESFQYEECRFPIDLSVGPLVELDHLDPIRTLAKTLALSSLLATLEGETDAAARHITGIFELANSLNAEPVLLSQVHRFAINLNAIESLEQSLNRVEFTSDEMGLLQESLIEADLDEPLVQGFIGERCWWDIGASVGWSDDPRWDFDDEMGKRVVFMIGLRPTGLFHAESTQWHETYDELMAAASLPMNQRADASRSIADRVSKRQALGVNSAILIPPVAHSLVFDVRLHAQLRAAIVALAAARFESDNGAYPESATQLTPEYLDAVPIDPFGGAPIQYKRLENGFVAYSLAQNLVDDGGVESDSVRDGWREGDLTFIVER